MESSRRPSRPAPLLSFVLALFAWPAAAQGPALGLRILPLPGYAPAGPELRAAARGDVPFPATVELLGDDADPLNNLSVGGEDLKDSVADRPSSEDLERGLRDESVTVRMNAVRDAAYPRDVAAVPNLAGVMLRLDQPAPLRAAAALALGRIGDRVAVPSLAEALKDPAPQVRYAAALSLGRLPADGVATRLERTLRTDPNWQARYAAAIALGRTRKAFTAEALADALGSDPAWQVRQQAARSLQDLGTAHAASALATALNDPEPSVRAAAGAGLALIGGPDQRRAVAQALRVEGDPTVRAVLALAERRSRSGF
ncbi:MAG TPA: HEAT repeat domain-containing protein [Elusimicrobiota bacterium]|jgi:HEAT repeat protein|nr:HEAT repeat domain-containing protein [Elusimicrobiota bacterium]